MKKVNIGLDIGIASVGWAIVNDDKFEIIDAGSRLFNEANEKNTGASAAIRREYRGRRRNLRRDKLRRDELRKLFIAQGWIKETKDFDLIQPTTKNVYQLRLEALSEPKHPNELMLIFSNFLKHRGIFNLKDETEKDDRKQDLDEKSEYQQKIAKINNQDLWASQIQLNNLKTEGSIKGEYNKILHQKYLDELNEILKTQTKFNLISKEFADKFKALFNQKRQYYQGPGKNSTFGWDGIEETFYNNLLGKDSYNRQENRAPKAGLYANIFNLLNDLNNLKIDDPERESKKLTKNEKELIINSIFNTDGKPSNLTLRRLTKILKIKKDNISGYRINKDEKPEFTEFKILNEIHKAVDKADILINWLNLNHCELIDELALIMTRGQSYDSRQEKIKECLEKHQINNADNLANQLANISFNGSHHLSNKTIKSLLGEMWETPHSSQEIFADRNWKPEYHFEINADAKYIPIATTKIKEMYISPVAKRSFIQALKVLKAIQRFCEKNGYEIMGVYIELAREKNTDDQKEFIKLQQKNNEKLNQEIKKWAVINSNEINQLSKKVLRKLRLLIEQGGKCAYCLEKLNWYQVMDESSFTEVDHIIPESISYSSNSDNLVLVHSKENHAKGQKTPYAYFRSKNTGLSWSTWEQKVKYELYKDFLQKNKNARYINRKIIHLLDETDFNDPDNVKGFIERNLNDTRISTTYLKEYLEECRSKKNFKFKIKAINGQFTDYIKRVYFDLPKKDRDKFEHHAIDAIAIAYSDWVRHKKIDQHQWSAYNPEIKNFDFRFSRMQNHHNLNKQFTNETLYSFRKNENDEFVKVKKIDIYTTDPKEIGKLGKLITKDTDKVLMAKADPISFSFLQEIWKEYIGLKYRESDRDQVVKNPFLYYKNIKKQPITKHQNKLGLDNPNLNAPIKNLRYQDNKLSRNHLNVTKKHPLTKENKIVAFESLKPIRLDFYKNKHTGRIKGLRLCVKDIQEEKKTKYSKIKENEKEIFQHKADLGIDSNYELICSVFPEDTIEIEKNNKKYLAVAIGIKVEPSVLEVKYLDKNRIKNERVIHSLGTINNISKKNFDILGVKKSKYMLEFNQ